MLKSGLIVGIAALIFGFGAAVISPICASCVALIAGLAAGYLAALFDKPADQGASAKAGASAGAIASLGGLLGSMIATVINLLVVSPTRAAEITQQLAQRLGLPSTTLGDPATIAANYYASAIGTSCCIVIFDIALMAGLGALGAILWYQTADKKTAAPTT